MRFEAEKLFSTSALACGLPLTRADSYGATPARLFAPSSPHSAKLIRRKDGQVFVLKPQSRPGSGLDVEGIDLDLRASEIVGFIHEGRRKYETWRHRFDIRSLLATI